jgi:hypothetical protein
VDVLSPLQGRRTTASGQFDPMLGCRKDLRRSELCLRPRALAKSSVVITPRSWFAGERARRAVSGGEAVPGLAVGALAEREDLGRFDAEGESGPAGGIAEPAVGDLETPVELGLPHRRQPLQLGRAGNAGGGSLHFATLPEGPKPGCPGCCWRSQIWSP